MPEQYQKEIEDILRQAEADAPLPKQRRQSLRAMVWQYARQSVSSDAGRFSPGRLMLAALAILLVAVVLRFMMPPILFGLLAWMGLALFIVAYAMFFLRPSNRGAARKQWRGRYLDGEASDGGGAGGAGQSWLGRLTRRFRK